MRKLRAHVHIKAPIQTVRLLANRQHDWMVTPRPLLVRTVGESWEMAEADGGTRFTLRMELQGRLPFVEDLFSGSVQESLAVSLGRLKQLAERNTPRLH